MSVSVIIPAYNAALSLPQCLDSILAQRQRPEQVIVVNDGSMDNTAEVVQRYVKDDFICYVEQPNRGQGAARNTGLGLATGEFIAFLDADDWWRPEFLDTCVGFLRSQPNVIAVSTGLVTRMFNGTEMMHPTRFCDPTAGVREPFVIDNFFAFWAQHDHVRTGSNVIRHRAIQEAGLQRDDLRIGQDLEYWGYLATFGKWAFIPRPLWVGNSRQAGREQGWLAKYALRRKLCPDVEQWGRRIEPRLKPWEREGYRAVRGRVAMVYAQSKILGGSRQAAYQTVRKYGTTMPHCSMRRLMCFGAHLGPLGWSMTCNAIWLREWLKAYRMRPKKRGQWI